MDESLSSLPTSHLLGSVPAVIPDGKSTKSQEVKFAVPGANMQNFPPANGANSGRGPRGYQTMGGQSEGENQQQSANNWKGFFSVYSYTQYFNVDTDIVLNRLLSSLQPTSGDFFNKIDANPDLYGLIWICTTLIFVIAAIGNCATYLIEKRSNHAASWTFDVGYVNVAAIGVYGYAFLVPLGFYFLLQYMGAKASLIRFWCLWGYSIFIFVPTSCFLIIPVEFLRWMLALIGGAVSSSFVAFNLKTYVESNDVTLVLAAAFVLQMAFAIFIKMWFFP